MLNIKTEHTSLTMESVLCFLSILLETATKDCIFQLKRIHQLRFSPQLKIQNNGCWQKNVSQWTEILFNKMRFFLLFLCFNLISFFGQQAIEQIHIGSMHFIYSAYSLFLPFRFSFCFCLQFIMSPFQIYLFFSRIRLLRLTCIIQSFISNPSGISFPLCIISHKSLIIFCGSFPEAEIKGFTSIFNFNFSAESFP